MDAQDNAARKVRRRRVVYIPGYDPVPPRKYRERYRREAAKQAALSGHEIALGPPRTDARFGWHVSARIEGAEVESEVEVAYWADIVRASMETGIWATYGHLFRTAWIYIGSGTLWRLMRLRKGPMIAALYPVAVLLGQLLLAAALAFGAFRLLSWGLVQLAGGVDAFAAALVLGGVAGVASLGAGVAFLSWCARRDHLLAWYLVRDYAFSAGRRGANPKAQEARMEELVARLSEALGDPDLDEVLVVGHSSGAYLAVSILADLYRLGRPQAARPVLSLLTLGQVVPMVSFLPEAHRLRADLAFLSRQSALAWVDVSAPGDGCSFALCDPVAVSGVAPPDKRWPLVISAAFSRTLRRETWARLRWRFFETHFQYLNAFDNLPGDPGAYDYFAVTAGPRTLAARFAARAPSASRIETPLSGYRAMERAMDTAA